MAKREKIIVGLMVAVLLYGVFDFFISSLPKESTSAAEAKLAEARDLAARIADSLQKEGLTSAEKFILERAAEEWTQDPFLGKQLVAMSAPPKAGETEIARFAYTGFVEAGNKRLAIINGMEYQVGEELEPGGHVLRSISHNSVVLENAAGGEKMEIQFAGEKY